MEFWDVYDKNRRPKGYKIMRGSDRRLGRDEYHLTAHVCLITDDGRMLIQKRAEHKGAWGGLWDITAGGSVLAGENTAEGAERELLEELGISAPLSAAMPIMTFYHGDCISDYFLLSGDVDVTLLKLQKSEVDDAKYATREEVLAMIRDGSFIPYKESFINLLYDMRDGRLF